MFILNVAKVSNNGVNVLYVKVIPVSKKLRFQNVLDATFPMFFYFHVDLTTFHFLLIYWSSALGH